MYFASTATRKENNAERMPKLIHMALSSYTLTRGSSEQCDSGR